MTSALEPESNSTAAQPTFAKPISLATIGGFLIGRREDILRIAASRSALILAAIFVLSAGFAREYDGQDLLHEPWHLLIPFGASLATSFALFLFIALLTIGRTFGGGSFLIRYFQLLTLYWMTAPLAWLYAIPFEQFWSAPLAMKANLSLLGFVALWRVLLMTRIVSVMYGCQVFESFLVVLLFADSVAQIAIAVTPRPIIDVMGGIRHSETETIILDVTCFIQVWGILLLGVLLLSVLVLAIHERFTAKPRWAPVDLPARGGPRVSRGSWLLAVVSILIWAIILPRTQVAQQNRWRVVNDLEAGRIEEALKYMSARSPADFPRYWEPGPRISYGESNPPFHLVVDALNRSDAAPWVRKIYEDRLVFQAEHAVEHSEGYPPFHLYKLNDDQLRRYIDMLNKMPKGNVVAACHTNELFEPNTQPSDDERPASSDTRSALLNDLHKLADTYKRQ